MFWKIGFFVLLSLVLAMGWLFIKVNPMKTEGASSWIDIYSAAPDETIKFLGTTFGTEIAEVKPGAVNGMDYTIIKAKGQIWPFAGVMALPMPGAQPHSMIYLTVKDYAKAHERMIANGATAVVTDESAGGMKFGIYIIPGGVDIGIAEYTGKK